MAEEALGLEEESGLNLRTRTTLGIQNTRKRNYYIWFILFYIICMDYLGGLSAPRKTSG